MADEARSPRSLFARPIRLNSSDYRGIQSWPYETEPFYLGQVRQMLLVDVPQLVLFEECVIWTYIDPMEGPGIVGFGTLNITEMYSERTGGVPHHYIPVLSIRPGITSFGYGQAIVDHLTAEAAINYKSQDSKIISDLLFLDTYVKNTKACRLYTEKCNFTVLNPNTPMVDPDQNNETYYVMARVIAH